MRCTCHYRIIYNSFAVLKISLTKIFYGLSILLIDSVPLDHIQAKIKKHDGGQTMLSNNFKHGSPRSQPTCDPWRFHMYRGTFWRRFDVMMTTFHLTLLHKAIVWRPWIDPQRIQPWVVYVAIGPSQIHIKIERAVKIMVSIFIFNWKQNHTRPCKN